MSSPAQGGPSVPKDKDGKKSVGGRMLTRMKTIMKRAEKRMSMSGKPGEAGEPSSTTAAGVKAQAKYVPLDRVRSFPLAHSLSLAPFLAVPGPYRSYREKLPTRARARR